MELLGLSLLGVLGGALTTVAGLGGGMMLVVVLSLTHDPRFALAVTAPALLVSNGHRAWMFRESLDRRVAFAFAIGLVPGALGGGLLLPALPTWVLQALLVTVTLAALTRSRGWWSWKPNPRAMVPLGVGIGGVAATTGGAALLVGPVLISAGLRGDAYVATVALTGVSLHAGRVAGYAISGLVRWESVPQIAALLVGLLVGNLIGKKTRRSFPQGVETQVELVALCVCTLLAVVGLAR